MKRAGTLRRGLVLGCIVFALAMAAMAPGRTAPATSPDAEARTIRVGLPVYIVTYMDPGELLKIPNPLLDYLKRETGVNIVLSAPASYAAVVEGLEKEQLDIAEMGGLEYAQASARVGFKPLVQRDIDQDWHTVFLTQPDSKINALKDLNGHTFAFGSINSVSSRVMPEYLLREAKVDVKVIQDALARSKRVPNGRHDTMNYAVGFAVARREVDAGAMDRAYYQAMLRDGKITPQQVRVFLTSAPYTDPIWVVRKNFDAALTAKFANAMMKLDSSKPGDKAILDLFRATKYVRAKDSSYDVLRRAAKADGLME